MRRDVLSRVCHRSAFVLEAKIGIPVSIFRPIMETAGLPGAFRVPSGRGLSSPDDAGTWLARLVVSGSTG